MLIQELINKVVSNNFTASQSSYCEAVNEQACRHSKRKIYRPENANAKNLFNSLRPNEDDISLKHRLRNERQITIEPIYKFKNKISRIIEFTYNLSESLQKVNFNPHLHVNDLLDHTFVDPNGATATIPLHPMDKTLPPNLNGTEKNVDYLIKDLKHSEICFINDDFICFYWIEVPFDRSTAKSYLIADKENWYWLKPARENKQITYKTELWYNHNSGKVPFNKLAGIRSFDDEGNSYNESFLFGAYVYFDEVINAFSDNQIVRTRYNYPKTVMAEINCPEIGCTNGYIFEMEGGVSKKDATGLPIKHACKSCNGTGKIQDPGPYSTLTIPQGSLMEKGSNLSSALQYIHADVSILKESYFTPFDLLQKGAKAIGLDLLEDAGANSSDLSLERRQEDLLDMLKNVSNVVYDIIDNIMFQIEALLNPSISEREPNKINRPASFEIKSSAQLLENAKMALFEDKINSRMMYYSNKYKNDATTIDIYRMCLLASPILALEFEDLTNYQALGIVNNYDLIKRMHVYNAVKEIYEPELKLKELNEKIKAYLIDNGFWVDPIETSDSKSYEDVTDVSQLPDDLDEIEEVLTKLVNNLIKREDAIRLIEIIEGLDTVDAENLLKETGL